MVRELGDTLGIPMHVFGPESHMTAIVGMALGKRDIPTDIVDSSTTTANFLLAGNRTIHRLFPHAQVKEGVRFT